MKYLGEIDIISRPTPIQNKPITPFGPPKLELLISYIMSSCLHHLSANFHLLFVVIRNDDFGGDDFGFQFVDALTHGFGQ